MPFTIPGSAASPPVDRHTNRFSPLSAEIYDEPGVPHAAGVPQVLHPPGESDTDSAIHTLARSDGGEEGDDDTGGHSEPEEGEVVGTFDPPFEDVPIGVDGARASMARGFRSLDQITLDTEFRSRGRLMRVVPQIMRGVVRTAFRLSFQEAAEARAAGNVEQETRAWKLFTLVPRMLLTKRPRGGFVSRAQTFRALRCVRTKEWLSLVEASRACAQSSSTLLHGSIALAIPSHLETDPQMLVHWGCADDDHLGK